MNRLNACLALTCLLWTATAAGQSVRSLLATAPADRSVDVGESEFEIQATTDDTTATIKASRSIAGTKVPTTVQLAASAPLAKSGATNLATWSGFPNAFTLTGKYTGYLVKGRRTGVLQGTDRLTFDRLCSEMRANAREAGRPESEAAELDCATDNIVSFLPSSEVLFDSLFWDEATTHYMWGGSATVGHGVFEYLDATSVETKTATRTPWGFSAYAAMIPKNSLMLLTGGIEYRDKHKDADAATICPPGDGTTAQQCKTGSLGEPVNQQQKLVFGEVRRNFGKTAASLKVGYDFENDNWSADLPLYLVRSASGALAGGIRAGWEDGKDVQLGVFVSSSFSLFP
jgi:hypothetical protein